MTHRKRGSLRTGGRTASISSDSANSHGEGEREGAELEFGSRRPQKKKLLESGEGLAAPARWLGDYFACLYTCLGTLMSGRGE